MWLIIIAAIVVVLVGAFFLYTPPKASKITWGVVFSEMHAQKMGLDWKETYLALLDDLKVRDLKVAVDWDMIEPKDGQYSFDDLDWQLDAAAQRNARVILVIGMKTPRWPECHIPDWAAGVGKPKQQQDILDYLRTIVLRYQNRTEIVSWQVENEPLFPFGTCPWRDPQFLAHEADWVRSLDQAKRPVLISDSGEGSFWINAARIGDVVGTTMYRVAYFDDIDMYIHYPIPPAFYWIKKEFINKVFNKKVLCVELQAEPWCPGTLYNSTVEEQKKTMDIGQFKANLAFAQKTGFDTFYLWGDEWWYWMKTKQNDPSFWNEAAKLWQ